MGNIAHNKIHAEITSTPGDVNGVVAPTENDINSNATGYNFPISESANHAAGWDGSFLQEGLYSNMEWSTYTMPTAVPSANGQVPTSTLDISTGVWLTTWAAPGALTTNLSAVLTAGNTASTDINMSGYGISNTSYIGTDSASASTINILNATLMVLMYNT